MNIKIAGRVFRILFLFAFVLGPFWTPSTYAAARKPQNWVAFAANLPNNSVGAFNWAVGATLALTIDDPNIPGSPDYVGSEIVPENDLYGGTHTTFELPGFLLRPGQFMTITDGVTIKTHIITTVKVTSVNLDSDTISGTAEPNSEVGINAHYEPGGDYVHRSVVADVNGNWSTNLSIPGPNPGEWRPYDILPGSWGSAGQGDEDGDATYYMWSGFDIDGDGIVDETDNCPNENAFGYDADEDGCIDTASGLSTLIQNMPADEVAPNIKNSLLANVNSAIKSLNKGNVNAATNQLGAFINQVEAQRGKKISTPAAGLLITYAQNVMMKI